MVSAERLKEICVPLSSEHAYKKRKLRVATIGAGFSGLILAHKIQHEQPELQEFIDHVIFEANDDVGGTWRVNTYPGVQCDVPAHIYAFPFDPNPNWSKFYADGDEILAYVEKVATKWNLRRDVQFNTRVIGLEWLEEEGKWKIRVRKNGQEERDEFADVLVSAQGFLSQWKWPDIPGIHDFQGHKVHSAAWDHSYDYSHKRIGIIGNGSSAIQILPQMAKLPGTQIISFQREATWITQSLGQALGVGDQGDPEPQEKGDQEMVNGDVGVDMADVDASDEEVGSNFNPRYTSRDKARFRNPEKHKAYRKMLQHGMNKGFRLFRKNSPQNIKSTEVTISRMRAALNNDPSLCEKLIPNWTLGCRRLTPGEGYLESFLLPTVTLEKSPIKRITATGLETAQGTHHDVDVIVCATGFDVSHVPHYPVTGRGGVTLAQKWASEPESYLSVACPDMPNYFIFTGPNATVGHGTLLTSMTWTAEYICRWLHKIAGEGIKSVAPTQDATDEFVRYGDEIHETLTWTGGCKSWYKNHRVDGRLTATWPGSALLYREVILREIRGEDFDIRYWSGNRWKGVLGNGFTQIEAEAEEKEKHGETIDLAFYLNT
ncbi:putative sterigmatocystin biosynthesis monooxygenase stcW [Cladophialophora carrionii]|uniref:Putative sterigmatocystin biosynthesis monooxygenase stcW n=1 Tax=Cladophialophora carrionii TaxID=86049 RepID=A0A1C1CVT6_9EURO|nr:putative sterigmatocystin biosynthesis monooxygenase stcW [Cladophialophora carrionii]